MRATFDPAVRPGGYPKGSLRIYRGGVPLGSETPLSGHIEYLIEPPGGSAWAWALVDSRRPNDESNQQFASLYLMVGRFCHDHFGTVTPAGRGRVGSRLRLMTGFHGGAKMGAE